MATQSGPAGFRERPRSGAARRWRISGLSLGSLCTNRPSGTRLFLPAAHTKIHIPHPNCHFIAARLHPCLTDFLRLKRKDGAAQSWAVELPCALDFDRGPASNCNSTRKGAVGGVGHVCCIILATQHVGG